MSMKGKWYVRQLDLVTGECVKRINNIITEETITLEFCKQCILEASRNKTSRLEVATILDNIDEFALRLQRMVLDETFEPSPCEIFNKVEYGKVRHIEKPKFFPDQAIHHLLILLIRDKLEKRIDPYAIASMRNKGTHYGVRAITRWLSAKDAYKTCKYVIKGDIKQCFASVTPDVIYQTYERMIKDKKYLRLKHKVLFQHSSLPIGNYCSSYDLNLLLLPIDQMIRKQDYVSHYIRYMDDFIIFCKNKKRAWKLKDGLSILLSSFGLTLKGTYSLTKIQDTGVDFIGYRFFLKNTILRKRNLKHIIKLAKKMRKDGFYRLHDCRSLVSLMGMCTHCHSTWLIHFVLKEVNFVRIKKILREASRNGI